VIVFDVCGEIKAHFCDCAMIIWLSRLWQFVPLSNCAHLAVSFTI